MFSQFFHKSTRQPKPRQCRPAIEILEDRVTPSGLNYAIHGTSLVFSADQLAGGGTVWLATTAPGFIDVRYSTAADPTTVIPESIPEPATDAFTTIEMDAAAVAGSITINFDDPFSAKPTDSKDSPPIAPIFPNLQGKPFPAPGIQAQVLKLNGIAGTFTVNVIHNTQIVQIQDNAGNDVVNISGNTSQLSFVDNAPQPETINLGDSSHGIDGLQGYVYLSSQFSFLDATNELSVNIYAAASASAGTWSIGPGGPFGPGDELLGLQYVPAGANITSLNVAVNADLFDPMHPNLGSFTDAGPHEITLNLKTGSTLKQNFSSLGTAITAHGNGSTLESAGGETWLLTGQDSGTWPIPQVTGPDTQTFVWDGMTTLVGGGNDTLDYSALLGITPSPLVSHPDPTLDYHVDLVHGHATDVTDGISAFERVIPDRLVIDTPLTQSSVFEQAIDNLTIDIHATVAPLVPHVTGLPPGVDWGFDSSTQQISFAGKPTLAGVYHVTVSVFDQSMPVPEGRQITFEWDVNHVYHIVADPEDFNQTAPVNQPYGHFKVQVLDENGLFEDEFGPVSTPGLFAVTFQADVTHSQSAYFVRTTGGGGGGLGGLGGTTGGGGGPVVTTHVPTFVAHTDADGFAEIGIDDASTLIANGFAGPFTLEVQVAGALSTFPIAPVDFTLTNVAASVATTTDLVSSANPSISGQTVTYTANVIRQDNQTATGTIQFTINGVNQGAPVPLSGGMATLQTSLISLGGVTSNFTVAANYDSGDPTVDDSIGSLTQEVDPISVHSIASAISQSQQTGTPIIVLAPASQLPIMLPLLGNVTSPTQSVGFTLKITGGTSPAIFVSLPANVNLSIEGTGVILGGTGSAVTMAAGSLTINGIALKSTGKAPTILVKGGSLKLRHAPVQAVRNGATTIAIFGGTVDAGTAKDPGANVLTIARDGKYIKNDTAKLVSAVENIFVLSKRVLLSPYRIEIHISDGITNAKFGLVMFVDKKFFVTLNKASAAATQNAINGDPANSIIYRQPGLAKEKYTLKNNVTVVTKTGTELAKLGIDVFTPNPTGSGSILGGARTMVTLSDTPILGADALSVSVSSFAGTDPVPTGSVEILVSNDGPFDPFLPYADVALENGTAFVAIASSIAPEKRSIMAVYLGDANYGTSSTTLRVVAVVPRQP